MSVKLAVVFYVKFCLASCFPFPLWTFRADRAPKQQTCITKSILVHMWKRFWEYFCESPLFIYFLHACSCILEVQFELFQWHHFMFRVVAIQIWQYRKGFPTPAPFFFLNIQWICGPAQLRFKVVHRLWFNVSWGSEAAFVLKGN